MAEILIQGIAQHPHLFTPSAPQGTTERRYSINALIHKTSPELPALIAAVEAAKVATFPGGMPANANTCLTDLATIGGTDPRLHDYYRLTCATKEDQGQPSVLDAMKQPSINPNVIQPGDMVWVAGNITGYTIGNQGVKCYLNATMATGQKGNIPTELLSARPSAEVLFANVPATVEPPVAAAPPPVAAAPPPVAAAPPPAVHQMTVSAQGATYEAMIANGWTDETLIANGHMLPPGGQPLSFMG